MWGVNCYLPCKQDWETGSYFPLLLAKSSQCGAPSGALFFASFPLKVSFAQVPAAMLMFGVIWCSFSLHLVSDTNEICDVFPVE